MLLKQIECSVQKSLTEMLASNHWRRYEGDYSSALTDQLALILGHTFVHLASSGTAALETVLRGAGIGPGDEVLLAAYDYPGNFWAIERCGARPVLVDVAAGSWAIDHDTLRAAFRNECKALVASHLHGELQPIAALREWCDDHQILLIEDACQSLGAQCHQSIPLNSTVNRGHVTIASFGGGKVISCGRGGAWATSDPVLAQRTKIAAGAGSGPYTMSEIQAAVVLAQLPWLEQINAYCRLFFKTLGEQLVAHGCDWKFVAEPVLATTAFYQAGWQIPHVDDNASRDRSLRELFIDKLQRGIPFAEGTGDATKLSSGKNNPTSPLVPFGPGFPGFHRRSGRRCRIPSAPVNAAFAASNTIVLSHQVALQAQITAEHIASRIQAIAASI